MEKEAVPFTALTENFSSMPLMAPPPLGNEIEGISIELDLVLPLSVLNNGLLFPSCVEESLFFLFRYRVPGVIPQVLPMLHYVHSESLVIGAHRNDAD